MSDAMRTNKCIDSVYQFDYIIQDARCFFFILVFDLNAHADVLVSCSLF
jgi:hypothetical protein